MLIKSNQWAPALLITLGESNRLITPHIEYKRLGEI